MFIELTITWVPKGFSGCIWLDTKNCVKKSLASVLVKNLAKILPRSCKMLFLAENIYGFRFVSTLKCYIDFDKTLSENLRNCKTRSFARSGWNLGKILQFEQFGQNQRLIAIHTRTIIDYILTHDWVFCYLLTYLITYFLTYLHTHTALPRSLQDTFFIKGMLDIRYKKHVFQYARKDLSDWIVLNVVTVIVVMYAPSRAGNVHLVAALDGLDPVATTQVLDTLDFCRKKNQNPNLITAWKSAHIPSVQI